jgi:nodulation protein E
MTPGLCRPFSKGRDGMVLGEGAAVFLLENEMSARRGAKPLAVLAGYGTSSDAMDIVRPDPGGAARSMQLALADANLKPRDIGYINAHGTGTILNDASESESLRLVFDDSLPGILVSSTKPVHGHALGAAGAIELVATICALREGLAPATINWQEPDPRCIPDPVANTARTKDMEFAMSNSFAFGGINASLIVKRIAP